MRRSCCRPEAGERVGRTLLSAAFDIDFEVGPFPTSSGVMSEKAAWPGQNLTPIPTPEGGPFKLGLSGVFLRRAHPQCRENPSPLPLTRCPLRFDLYHATLPHCIVSKVGGWPVQNLTPIPTPEGGPFK